MRGRPDRFLRGDRDWLDIRDYRVEDISTDQSVNIMSGSALVGDVSAPRVVISGLIQGCITAREVIMEAHSQVWGDIYCVSIQLAPNGKLNGWISTYDEGTIDLLMANQLTPTDLPAANLESMPKKLRKWLQEHSDLGNSNLGAESGTRVGIWKQLRMEAASALLARVELEAKLRAPSDVFALPLKEEPEIESQDSSDKAHVVEGDESDKLSATNAEHEEMMDDSSAESLANQPKSREEPKENDVLLLTRASLETAQREQQKLIKELNRLNNQLHLDQSKVANLEQKNVRLIEQLAEAEYKLIASDLEINRASNGLEGKQVEPDSRSEKDPRDVVVEGDYMLERLESHSKQLAKLKASLVERDIELQLARKQNIEIEKELIRVKRLASVRIKQLQAQLSELQTDKAGYSEHD